MRMMVRGIVDGIHVRLSMVSRVGPRSRRRRRSPVKLMMLLAWYTRDLHCRYRVHVVGRGWQNRGAGAAASRRGPLCRVLHAGNRGRLALVRLAVPKSFRERVTRDLELGDPVILIGGHRGEPRLGEGERFEILGARVGCRARRRGRHHHVAAWLVSMHRVQDYLQSIVEMNDAIRFFFFSQDHDRYDCWRKKRGRERGEKKKRRRHTWGCCFSRRKDCRRGAVTMFDSHKRLGD